MTNEKTSPAWQLYQLKQRLDEWWELRSIKLQDNLPDDSFFSWLDSDWLKTTTEFIFWLIVFFLVGWLMLKMIDLAQKYWFKYQNKYSFNTINQQSKNKKVLPVNKWWKKSHNFAQQGNYRDAILCLYMAMLQRLNDAGVALHQLSRTDGEYLQIIQSLPNFNYYQILLINHQKLLFANQEATINMWQECQQAFEEINLNNVS